MNLNFTWEIQEMTERELTIQLSFKTALFVSSSGEPDTLRMFINDKFMFVSTQDIPIDLDSRKERNLQSSTQGQLILERVLPT